MNEFKSIQKRRDYQIYKEVTRDNEVPKPAYQTLILGLSIPRLYCLSISFIFFFLVVLGVGSQTTVQKVKHHTGNNTGQKCILITQSTQHLVVLWNFLKNETNSFDYEVNLTSRPNKVMLKLIFESLDPRGEEIIVKRAGWTRMDMYINHDVIISEIQEEFLPCLYRLNDGIC